MTASRIFLDLPLGRPMSGLADVVVQETVIVHNHRRGNENTLGPAFRLPELPAGFIQDPAPGNGWIASNMARVIQSANSCCPNSGRAAGACRAFRSAAA